MKKIRITGRKIPSFWNKSLRLMKLTFLFLVVGLMQLSASVYSQTTKLSLEMRNAKVAEVLDAIEKQSEFRFAYSPGFIDLTREVSIDINDKTIDESLQVIFTGTGVEFSVFDRHILLYPESLSPGAELVVSHATGAQQLTVSGTVTDESGLPLPGVTVVIKGTSQGTVTNADGNFSLSNISEDATLVFSFVGMKTQEVAVKNQNVIDVSMQVDAIGIEEVVAIGYGTMKKSDLTGSVAQVKMKDEYNQLPNVSVIQALQGTIAGLNVGMAETAGENPSLSIRGYNSLSTSSADNAPLIVVDGAIYRGSLIDLNPTDIESINILKDASSAAIYGSQASNGVIIITTQKGAISEKPVFTYSNNFTLQVPSKNIVPMDGDELEQFILDAHWFRGSRVAPDYLQPNPDYDVSPYLFTTEIREGYKTGRETDWYNMFTDNGHIHSHNLSVMGRNQGFGYFISFGYNDTKGFIKNDEYKRYNLRANFDSKINEWLSFGFESFLTSSDYSGVSPDITTIFATQPWAPIYDSNGDYIKMPSGAEENPFLTIQQDDEDKGFNLFGNFHADLKIPKIDGLNYRINYNQNYNTGFQNRFNAEGARYTGSAYKNSSIYNMWAVDNILSYQKMFNDIHNLNVTLVYGLDEVRLSNTNSNAEKFTNNELGYNRMQAGDPALFAISSGAGKENSIYSMARVIYGFKSKYLFTGTVRRDGFSGFGLDRKIGVFPSVALGWVASEENFLDVSWMDYLKFRLSYGSSGRRAVNRYDTKAVLSSEPNYIFGDGSSARIGQWIASMANNELGWETTTGINAGIDFNLIQSRIRGNIEYYSNNTKDILYFIQLPVLTGFEGVNGNVGKVHNHGLELTLNGDIINKNGFKWDATINFSRNRNRIVSILGPDENGREEDLVANLLFINEPQNLIYGYETSGEMWQISDEQNGVIPEGFAPGHFKIVDQNTDGKYSASDDRVILGYRDPSYRVGVANTLSFKNLSLYFFINSIQGGKNYYKQEAVAPREWNNYEFITHYNGPRGGFDYWMPENPDAKYRRLDVAPTYSGFSIDQRNFIRLQDITLSYSLSPKIINRYSVNKLRLFVSGKNLLTLTDWEGWDPETGRGLGAGIPVMTNYSVGLNVEF